MLNLFKALLVILPVIFLVFFASRFVFANIVDPRRMDKWGALFATVTILGFMLPNFWLMLIALAMILMFFVFFRLEPNLPALFAVLVCALPPQERPIPGFGGINQLFAISPPLLMSIIILLAALFYTRRMGAKLNGIYLTDFFMYGFVAVSFVLAFRDTSFTDGLRAVWLVFVSIFLPYFIFSRWAKTMEEIKVICVAILVPLLTLSAMAYLETVFRWHFYEMPAANWHDLQIALYSYRSGFLRVYASITGPIEFGFLLMIALSLAYAVKGSRVPKNLSTMGILGISGALLLTFSRGPWFGAIFATGMFVISGPKGLTRGFLAGVAGIFGLVILALSPMGDQVLSLLPFFGDLDAGGGTYSYRQKLFENGVEVILQNPFFGSSDFYDNPKIQELVQGQGIVDLVNSYIQVGLAKGLVGLFLFVGVLGSAIFAAWRAMRILAPISPEMSGYARAFFAAMMGVLLVIATTSSIAQVPIFYWLLAGLCVSIRRLAFQAKRDGFASVAGGTFELDSLNQAPSSQREQHKGSIRSARETSGTTSHTEISEDVDDAEALAHRRRNEHKKSAAQEQAIRQTVPAHLRQYQIRKPDTPPKSTKFPKNDDKK